MMSVDSPVRLEIDLEFKEMIRPLSREEYRLLEESICAEGCREPLVVWNGKIIDGYNRYQICHFHNIPFQIREKQFDSREDVIVWIASNQLGRRNISEETRKYLIGKRFEAEKIIGRRNLYQSAAASDEPHFEVEAEEVPEATDADSEQKPVRVSVKNPTAERIGKEYHVAHGTVEKYGAYSRALDIIEKSEPNIVRGILSGAFKVSHDNIIALSRMDETEIRRFGRKLKQQRKSGTFVPYRVSRDGMKDNKEVIVLQPEIKKMPPFDPDSKVNELALTIPTWSNSIKNVRTGMDSRLVSDGAKKKLEKALMNLTVQISDMLIQIREVPK